MTAVDRMKDFVDDDTCRDPGRDSCTAVNHVSNLVSNLDLDFDVGCDRRGLEIDCDLGDLPLPLISADHENVENFDESVMSRVMESLILTAVAGRSVLTSLASEVEVVLRL